MSREHPAPLRIVGGTVLTGVPGTAADPADVLLEDGRVAAVEAARSGGAGERLDAAGCYVLPGGVEPHSHVMSDVAAATRAAALGGTTTVLSFTNPAPGERALAAFQRRREELGSVATVDVGLHAMLYTPDCVDREELSALREEGVCGLKVFLAYPELGIMWSTRGLFELLCAAASLGQVVQVHAEEGDLIESLLAAALSNGRVGPRVFSETRPPETEAAAVALVLHAARLAGARSYLTHLSCAASLDQVRLARRRGWDFSAEACLHHLLLDDSLLERPDAERYLVVPPLRPRSDAEALWGAVLDGTLDALGSDHSQAPSRTVGALSPDGSGYAYGLAGIGARLPLVLSEGRRRGVPIERLVDLLTAGPARAFGLDGKGALVPGHDGDLVVYDPEGSTILTAATFDDGTGDSVYSGRALTGGVRHVVLRGQVVVRDGELVADPPAGRFAPGGGR